MEYFGGGVGADCQYDIGWIAEKARMMTEVQNGGYCGYVNEQQTLPFAGVFTDSDTGVKTRYHAGASFPKDGQFCIDYSIDGQLLIDAVQNFTSKTNTGQYRYEVDTTQAFFPDHNTADGQIRYREPNMAAIPPEFPYVAGVGVGALGTYMPAHQGYGGIGVRI